MERGQFKVIRTDGTEETFAIKPTNKLVKLAIGAETLDTVTLSRSGRGMAETIMLLDDIGTGFVSTGFGFRRVGPTKPVNDKATKLYWSVCKPGTTHQIHGDVAICNDEDFA